MRERSGLPSRLFRWILGRLSIYEDMFLISRDFEIEYRQISESRGRLRGDLWLLGNTILAVRSYLALIMRWRSVMFRNYLKIALRNTFRFRMHSIIKIFSLSLGIAGCILIYLFIQDELSFDRFHENGRFLYRVVHISYDKDSGRETGRSQFLPPPMGPVLAEFCAEIKHQSRFTTGTAVIRYRDKLFSETLSLVDPPFLEMFSFPLIYGDPGGALSDDHSVVLTRSHAEKYFGDKNPMGESLRFSFGHIQKDFVVTGVVQDVPHNSSLQFDILINARNLPAAWNDPGVFDQWNRWAFPMFVELEHEVPQGQAEARLAQFCSLYFGDNVQRHLDRGYDPFTFGLQNLSEMRVDTRVAGTEGLSTAYILLAIALCILLVACVNFTNLSLGLSSIRSTEVGMRKVLGAGRKQLAWQYMGEALLASLLAVGLGLLLTEMLLPSFNSLAGKALSLYSILRGYHVLALLGMAAITGMIAGSYPALVMSSFHPVDILRGKLRIGGRTMLTKGLVVLQFTLSVALAVSAVVLGRQASFLVTSDPGYDSRGLVVILTQENQLEASEKLYQRFKSEIMQNSGIEAVTASNREFGLFLPQTSLDVGGRKVYYNFNRVDAGFVSALQLRLVQGRDFSPTAAADRESVIVNQKFVEELGPEFTLGTPLGDVSRGFPYNCRIVGVVEDSHVRSLRSEIEPVLLYIGKGASPNRDRFSRVFVRIDASRIQETLGFLEAAWEKTSPDKPFLHYLQADALESLYRGERRWSLIIRYSFALSLLLACLGIFGLTAMTLSRRDKEIGIRKVLGAGAGQIVAMTLKEYVVLTLIANLIAWPLVYLVLRRVLQGYPYRIGIAPHYFLLAGAFSILIAVFTILFLSIRAARANPADSLRCE
jgi:putative ABC transport system permease protein